MTSKQVFVRLRRRRVASRYPQRDLISSRKVRRYPLHVKYAVRSAQAAQVYRSARHRGLQPSFLEYLGSDHLDRAAGHPRHHPRRVQRQLQPCEIFSNGERLRRRVRIARESGVTCRREIASLEYVAQRAEVQRSHVLASLLHQDLKQSHVSALSFPRLQRLPIEARVFSRASSHFAQVHLEQIMIVLSTARPD